jgi:hypothetical protein
MKQNIGILPSQSLIAVSIGMNQNLGQSERRSDDLHVSLLDSGKKMPLLMESIEDVSQ